MNNRMRRMRRVLATQRQIERLSLWHLIGTEAHISDLKERQHQLISFTHAEFALSNALRASIMRRLERLGEALIEARSQSEALRTRHWEEKRSLRRAERLTRILERHAMREEASRHLAEVLELTAHQIRKLPASSL